MDSKPPGSSGTFFPSKNSFVSRFLNPVFVPNRTNQAESSAPSIRSPSASRKLGNSICRSLSSRNASPVPLIELEITNSLCHLCTNIFQSNIPLSPPDRPRSHLQKRGLIHHATSSSLEESISQGCRVCSQLPVLFNEEVKRKGPIIDNPKLREDISSTYFHLYDLHYRRFSVTLEFRNNTGNSWQLYHAFEISPTESIYTAMKVRFMS
jgi:hypothetical protein